MGYIYKKCVFLQHAGQSLRDILEFLRKEKNQTKKFENK